MNTPMTRYWSSIICIILSIAIYKIGLFIEGDKMKIITSYILIFIGGLGMLLIPAGLIDISISLLNIPSVITIFLLSSIILTVGFVMLYLCYYKNIAKKYDEDL